MLDLCLLGTGGMTPMPSRYLASMMLRCNGVDVLVDCGEGTQISMKKVGWSPKNIGIMCFTHMHADHISGLPGMLLSIANAERTEPIIMVGPKGLFQVTKSLRCIVPDLPYELRFVELDQETESYTIEGYQLTAFRLKHNLTCYGYRFVIPRQGKFLADQAMAQEIPQQYWNRLQKGETVTDEKTGKVYTPDMVLGPARRGIQVTYVTDTRPTPVITQMAEDADVLVCEGMYGEPGCEEKALKHHHMTMQEAAQLAAACQLKPREMLYTHYSPSMMRPKDYIAEMQKILPQAVCGKDGLIRELSFDGET